ncbi:hypothetical protein EDD17DRAFT_1491840 [Pisolithus thermaeus]|nr:hypothetical protein EDD17DRAFT_1491840 [Pisolithus thermaeus]
MTGPERKSKKHPTFQYLPKNRAKKLKRLWVDSKKLKSQWKAQKKREGIWSKSSSQPDNYGGETAIQSCPVGLSDPLVDSDRKVTDDILPVGEHSTEASTTNKVSLRELKRQAYSPSTLHNHKSDPRKRRGADTSSPHSASKNPSRHTKGQPNMKLRMNAVLEKIKRDLC